jgi:hypothetical protein
VEAYRARKISDEFSESKYIGFAMASMLQALLLGLPLGVLVTNNPAARLFTYSGIIFLISMSLLLLIFVPKVMIVFRDYQEKKPKRGESDLSHGTKGVRINMAGDIAHGRTGNSNTHSPFRTRTSDLASLPSISSLNPANEEELPEQDT